MADTQTNSNVDVPNLLGSLPSSISSMLKASGDVAQKKADIDVQTQKALTEKTAPINEAYRKQVEQQGQTQQKIAGQLAQPFQVPQETASDYGQLGGMVAMLGVLLGKSGKQSATNVLSAIDGTLKGYQQGRKDMIAASQKEFDTNMKRLQAEATNAAAMLENITKLRSVDLEKANQEVAQLKAIFTQSIASSDNIVQNAPKAMELANSLKNANTNAGNLALRTKEYNDRIIQQNIANKEAFITKDGQTIIYDKAKQQYTDLTGKPVDQQLAKGATKQGAASTRGGGLNDRYAFNIFESAGQAYTDLFNLTSMPADTVLGTFAGMTGQTGNTLISSLSNTLTREITNEDKRVMQQLVSGFENNMSRALGGGYANSSAKGAIEAYKQQVAQEGDTPLNQAIFLARAKQELGILAKSFANHPGANEGYIQGFKDYQDELNEAVPFTVSDVLTASRAGRSTVSEDLRNLTQPSSKPIPTDADREYVKNNPSARQKFIDRFGVQP